jgi:aminoglycoside phosphotransferase (APT) family kinase protein
MKGELLGRGGSAEVFAFGPGRVLKLFWPKYAYAVEMEARKARAVHGAGVRAPAVYGVVELEGRHGIVYERIDGPLLFAGLGGGDAAVREVGRRLAELHVEIHRHEVPELEDLVDQVGRTIESLPAPEQATARERIAQVPRGKRLYHGDFHPGNVILRPEPVVIDWVNAFSSHPAFDVARSVMTMRFQGVRDDTPARSLAIREAVTEVYLERYLAATDVTRDEIDRCARHCAAALLRHQPGGPARAELLRIAGGS